MCISRFHHSVQGRQMMMMMNTPPYTFFVDLCMTHKKSDVSKLSPYVIPFNNETNTILNCTHHSLICHYCSFLFDSFEGETTSINDVKIANIEHFVLVFIIETLNYRVVYPF